MNAHTLLGISVSVLLCACSSTQDTAMSSASLSVTAASLEDIHSVSPGLARIKSQTIDSEVWSRPGLSLRDRSIVTLSALIARNQVDTLPSQIELAFKNGVTPAEVSEIITHLAFYSGIGNAMSAVLATQPVFAQHGIDSTQLPAAQGNLLPMNEQSEAERAARVEASFGAIAPGVVALTTDALFRDLWLRPGLSPRDRGLVTVSALVAAGNLAQVPVHLNKAMDNGLTRVEASEALTQLAFYAGWPNVFSAMSVVKDVFAMRPDAQQDQ